MTPKIEKTKTLILGAGFGGLSCARALRTRLPAPHEIVLVDRAREFVVGAAKTWVMLGGRRAEEVARPIRSLVPPGVDLLHAEVKRIDAVNRSLDTNQGTIAGDHLVIALGADRDFGIVPGLADAAHSFYSLADAVRLREVLRAFDGGRLLLLIPRVPFSCPPAPYECVLMLHDALERRGIRAKTELELWTVEKAPMSTAGPAMAHAIKGLLSARGITFRSGVTVSEASAARRTVRFDDGSERSYDLLIAVPPHRVPRPVADAGLAGSSGWIPVDPRTLEVTVPGIPARVYAIGDVTSVPLPGRFDPSTPLVLPKAGVMAAAHGEVVAERITAAIKGAGQAAESRGIADAGASVDAEFDGRGFCFIEVGMCRAMRAEGSFFDLPHPVMSAGEPDERQYREKELWVESWESWNP